jgi:hypothetical protein
MARRILLLRIAAVCVLAALPLAVHADELTLQDGSTIKGTIVGFDDNAFKVQTSYGFALVRKDQVVTIRVTGSPAGPAPVTNPGPVADKTPAPDKPKTESGTAPAPKPAVAPAAAAASSPQKPVATQAATITAVPAPTAKLGPPPPLPSNTIVSSSMPPPTPPTVLASAAPKPAAPAPTRPPAPELIRETVSGTTYTNNSYKFEMYKPPGWQVLASERTVLPGAIAALGTDDQQTYLLIGQESAGKPLYLAAEAADKRLRDVMENFRPQGQEQILVAGLWATAHHFRGSVDQHEWSGVVVLVPHGSRLYTIFGMTRADTDLVQIQENVIARAIASLEFTE